MYILCRYSYIRFRTHMHQHYLNGQKQAISGSRIHGYGNFMCTIESLSRERVGDSKAGEPCRRCKKVDNAQCKHRLRFATIAKHAARRVTDS